ncbi:MAG: hypothetical protein K1X92_08685 [Bacteroidia bacterium]|nr:hypothetical protein [Bacteroidia bacterium]
MDSLELQLDNLILKADKMNRFISFLLEEREEMEKNIEELKIQTEKLTIEKEELKKILKTKQSLTPAQKSEIKQSIDEYLVAIDSCLNKFGD